MLYTATILLLNLHAVLSAETDLIFANAPVYIIMLSIMSVLTFKLRRLLKLRKLCIYEYLLLSILLLLISIMADLVFRGVFVLLLVCLSVFTLVSYLICRSIV